MGPSARLGLLPQPSPNSAQAAGVKEVALHLLDDDLGWLSRGRDGDMTGLLSAEG